jgi:hypothetical protein
LLGGLWVSVDVFRARLASDLPGQGTGRRGRRRLALRLLPRTARGTRAGLDVVGVAGTCVSIALALVPLLLGPSYGWPAWVWISLAAGVPTLALAFRWERRTATRGGSPLLDLDMFRQRTFAVGLAINVAFIAGFTSSLFALSLMLSPVSGWRPGRPVWCSVRWRCCRC